MADVELIGALPLCQRDPEFAAAERHEAYAARLRSLGGHAVQWTYEPEAEATVAALKERLGLSVDPIVPNMRAYLRDASDFGIVGAAWHRFRRLGPSAQIRLGFRNVRRVPKILSRDFTTGLLLLVEMELARLRRYAPTSVYLTASVTDLALALDRKELLAGFVRLVDRSYGLVAGLATYNYGMLEERLRAWGVRPGAVAAPFNPRGYLMNPSRAACETAIRTARAEVVATHIEVDGLVPRAAAVEYLRGLGIRRAVVHLGV